MLKRQIRIPWRFLFWSFPTPQVQSLIQSLLTPKCTCETLKNILNVIMIWTRIIYSCL